jgi:alpha-1,2-mannosyltransferase
VNQEIDDSRKILLTKIIMRSIMVCSQILIAEFIIGFSLWYFLADGFKDKAGTPLGADFLNVYAAGFLANLGHPEMAYNWEFHGHIEQGIAGYAAPYYGWHYPPFFLIVASLLALFPYLWAFGLYMGASFVAYWTVIRSILPKTRELIWALVAFPGVFLNISNGQNGFITTALFGAAFFWLETEPWLAGVMFGFLIYKPQFFIVIPFILAVGGYGRVFFATIMTALGSLIASWILFGTSTWEAFFSSTTLTQHIILEQGSTGWNKIQSIFSMARMWGADLTTAYFLHGIIAGAALLALFWIWCGKATLETRAAALCGAMLLVTPYVMDYDLVLLAVPIAFLVRQGLDGEFLPYEKAILTLLWILPLVARNVGLHYVTFTPPLLIMLIGLCISRTYYFRQSALLHCV